MDAHIEVPMELEAGSHVPKIDGGDIYRALAEHRGNIAAAAADLGVRRNYLVERINVTPELKVLLEDTREGIVDKAEQNIFTEVERGDGAASRFVVQTIGKARGWSQGVSGDKGGAIEVVIRKLGDAE